VPLSDHEQRLLDQIERALYAEDPKFAASVRAADLRTHLRRRVWRAAALLGVGLVVLLIGVVSQLWIVGGVGFLIMLFSALVLVQSGQRLSGRERPHLQSVDGPQRAARASREDRTRERDAEDRSRERRRDRPRGPSGGPRNSGGGFMERFEERWRRRMDGDDQ
jgi:type VI protein secretion system component VasK